MENRPELTEEFLRKEYLVLMKGTDLISQETGWGKTTVYRNLKMCGIIIRTPSEANNLPKRRELAHIISSGSNNQMYGKPAWNRGRKHPEETRRKISIALTGKKLSSDHKKLLSVIRKGQKFSVTHKKNISQGLMGKFGGEKSPMWRGGVSFDPYCPKFNEMFKERIRARFSRTCYLCPITEYENGIKLSIHHIDYAKNSICNGKEWAFVPLCKYHHSKSNFDRWYWFNLLINYWATNSEINLESPCPMMIYPYQ